MKTLFGKVRRAFGTLSLTVLLCLNLSLIVFFLLALVTLLVRLGVDGGFFLKNGYVTLGGGLVFLYAVCIVITASVVLMIRLTFIRPIRRIMKAMRKLARGDFSQRIELDRDPYNPKEIREFAESFNRTAQELSGTEILRKDFINNFSHEFKTPIVSIQGFADLLLEESLPVEEQREYLTIIRDESRRLAELAASILALNRIESRHILTDLDTLRVDEQLRQTVLVTQQKWREKRLIFQVDLEKLSLEGSASLLQEVWLNLLDNAAKFSPEDAVIEIQLRKRGDCAEAAFTDCGPGMDAETKSHIFEQFYQGDTSRRTQGNGLGLAMVKKIVELHGGKIRVDAAQGRGSCFTVTLPMAQPFHGEVGSKSESER